jgi:peptidoglycan/xylan/chitin deacetylase (PgdA/CDA1 family)
MSSWAAVPGTGTASYGRNAPPPIQWHQMGLLPRTLPRTVSRLRADGAVSWLPVLMYHRVTPQPPAHDPFGNFTSTAAFDAHLRWLSTNGWRSVSLGQVAVALGGGPPLPSRAFAITFDDGYRDNYDHAWPLLRHYGLKATVFMVSGAVGGDSSFDSGSGYEPAPMLSVAEMRFMHTAGVEFGSHTRSHPDALPQLSAHELRDELAGSRRDLEAILDAPVDLFAYPHSRHDARVEAAVAAAGYRLACGGTGTRLEPACVNRVLPPSYGYGSLAAAIRWRRIKWHARRWTRVGAA